MLRGADVSLLTFLILLLAFSLFVVGPFLWVAFQEFVSVRDAILMTLVAVVSQRKRALTLEGTFAALVLGLVCLQAFSIGFFLSLLLFLAGGTFATKLNKLNASAEFSDDHKGRNAAQVLCNCLVPLGIGLFIVGCRVHSLFFQTELMTNKLVRTLEYIALSSVASAFGDTLASDLGSMSKSPPVLLSLDPHPPYISARAVPVGTNGAVTFAGTAWSAAAGGMLFVLWMAVNFTRRDLVVAFVSTVIAAPFGSVVDSILGRYFQETRASHGKVLKAGEVSEDAEIVCGEPYLDNDMVNLSSQVLTALFLARVSAEPYYFSA
ncbi:MAG: uncharacterized protein KVP18_002233 [Porospora cf. gigantea A]|uniref:uncharacterized protein n=1 Tax=Porospora cf. gigantea A TaxID=2853593 RepID=UPI0035598879|nr:MAG: hypothetical protein KVP18_002233 [Porospora cf. gigantea A]